MESIFNSSILRSGERKYPETVEITYMAIKESKGGGFHRNQEKKRFVYVQSSLHDIQRGTGKFLCTVLPVSLAQENSVGVQKLKRARNLGKTEE